MCVCVCMCTSLQEQVPFVHFMPLLSGLASSYCHLLAFVVIVIFTGRACVSLCLNLHFRFFYAFRLLALLAVWIEGTAATTTTHNVSPHQQQRQHCCSAVRCILVVNGLCTTRTPSTAAFLFCCRTTTATTIRLQKRTRAT